MMNLIENLLNLAFMGFWHFVGVLILITTVLGVVFVAPLKILFLIVNRSLRHKNIMKHGYPPVHCDADGDLKEEIKKD
jgi:hypothetical protein